MKGVSMKPLRSLAAACVVLALAGMVYAQGSSLGWGQKPTPLQSGTNPQGQLKVGIVGGVKPDSTAAPFTFDATGKSYFSEAYKDRDNWRLYPNIINNQLNSTTAGVDSSQAQDTHDMRSLALVLYGQQDSLSTIVRIAVQIRGHYTTASDSGSAYPWYRWPVRSTTAGTDAIDSLGHFSWGIATVAQATSANSANGGLWSGEFLVRFDVARNDSTGTGLGKYGAYPKGMWINLVDHDGVPFRAPYTSVRVRVINGVRSRFRIRADLVGSSL
jgi:hypothetical protein